VGRISFLACCFAQGVTLRMQNPANKQFGSYEIVAELGRGAMGIVYKALDSQSGRMVALKTVLLRGHDREQEEEFRKRFVCEAQAAGRLRHPGIIAIYDAGENQENHDPYVVLEFVTGEPLSKILAREGKLSLSRALQVAEEIAEALDYAHGQGVVHRGIKPGNILISEEGRAKIADFGIAHLNLAHLTQPAAYMAPEQLSGEGADGRSDLFSLGVILYAMVTGHSPFQGNSMDTVCFKVVNRDPMPVSALDMDLPPALDVVISKAMAKDPAKRYQRGSEFMEDLRRLTPQPEATSAILRAISGPRIKTNLTSVPPKAASARVQKEQLVHAPLRKTPFKHLTIGAALVVVLILVAFRAQRAIVVRSEAKSEIEAQKKGTSTPTPPAATSIANARASIIAEMEVASSTPAADPATPSLAVRTNTLAKTAPRRVSVKTRSNASISLPATLPVVKHVVAPLSTLELAVEHQFKEAVLFVWVDDQLTLTHPLHGVKAVFKEAHGVDSESVQIPSGTHQLRVRAQSSDLAIDLSKTISADFTPGGEKTLRITFDKHNTAMFLTWPLPTTSH
jgi:serine/threonine protein kinase